MATRPVPEKLAEELLEIFIEEFQSQPGDILQADDYLTIWPQRGHASHNFAVALEYAIEHGWLEAMPGGDAYRLTEEGFALA